MMHMQGPTLLLALIQITGVYSKAVRDIHPHIVFIITKEYGVVL